MTRQLIHEDKELFEKIKKDLNAFSPLLVKMQNTYEGLEIGNFTNEVIQLLKNKGANPIEVAFYEYISTQLEASGVTSKIIRQNMINGSEPLFREFKTAFQNAKDFIPRQYGLDLRPVLDFAHISFKDENGLFIISQKSQDEILETY